MKRIITITTDDLDGTEGAVERSFGLDGNTYVIDLSAVNYDKLHDALERYIAAGVTVSRSGVRKPTQTRVVPIPAQQRRGANEYSWPDVPVKEVRDWWREQAAAGRFVGFHANGRIPNFVIRAWLDRDGASVNR